MAWTRCAARRRRGCCSSRRARRSCCRPRAPTRKPCWPGWNGWNVEVAWPACRRPARSARRRLLSRRRARPRRPADAAGSPAGRPGAGASPAPDVVPAARPPVGGGTACRRCRPGLVLRVTALQAARCLPPRRKPARRGTEGAAPPGTTPPAPSPAPPGTAPPGTTPPAPPGTARLRHRRDQLDHAGGGRGVAAGGRRRGGMHGAAAGARGAQRAAPASGARGSSRSAATGRDPRCGQRERRVAWTPLSNVTAVLSTTVSTLRFAWDGDVKGFTTSATRRGPEVGPRVTVRPERPDQGHCPVTTRARLAGTVGPPNASPTARPIRVRGLPRRPRQAGECPQQKAGTVLAGAGRLRHRGAAGEPGTRAPGASGQDSGGAGSRGPRGGAGRTGNPARDTADTPSAGRTVGNPPVPAAPTANAGPSPAGGAPIGGPANGRPMGGPARAAPASPGTASRGTASRPGGAGTTARTSRTRSRPRMPRTWPHPARPKSPGWT